MANLKIVKEAETRWSDYYEVDEVYIHSRVLNVDTNKYVEDKESLIKYGYNTIHTENEEDCNDEGLHIVKVNGECKAIVKWKQAIYERNGQAVTLNEKSTTDEILSIVKDVTVYNTNGKKLFETERFFGDPYCITFKIKFSESTITCMEISSSYPAEHTFYKNVYDYDGQILLSKVQNITNDEILDKVNTDEKELSM